MTTFSERLAASAEVARPTVDVQVTLDAALAARVEELQDALQAAQDAYTADPRLSATAEIKTAQEALDAVLEEAREALITLRFTRMDGDMWSELTSRCPARLDVDMDKVYGFNVNAVLALAAPLSGVLVEGDTVAEIPEADWRVLFKRLSGYELSLINDAIFSLNVWGPSQRVAELKKGFTAPRD
ncbi:MAG TPA: hypothetical protein VFU07_07105 [Candidatus Lumbricidophila sp.]|nr:hypothetical protein [Candidatus Lumbricidophila sp.]